MQNFGAQEIFYQVIIKRQTAEMTAVTISSNASSATMGYGYKNSVLALVSSSCA
jgi:hypothetical protein